MNAVATPQPYEVPEGGLASFLTATVGDWSDEALNSDTYYDIVKPTAEQLAEFGREEDDRIAHVATGETVVPMAVFEEDPALKEALFARMRDMGIEPERYVVGNELNSINPVTGQPEFFLKKIFKGIKKAVKGVVKVFKKIAPIVLSIGLSFIPGVGPILAGTLGGGIGTLIQGGSLKDALKGALIGGAMGGLSSGIGSVLKGGEFMAGVKAGLPKSLGGGFNPTLPDLLTPSTPSLPADELLTPPASGGVPTNLDVSPTNLDMSAIPGAKQAQLAQQVKTASGGIPTNLDMSPIPGAKQAQLAQQVKTPTIDAVQTGAESTTGVQPGASDFVDASGAITGAGEAAVRATLDQRGFLESMRDFFTTGDFGSLKQAFIPDNLTASKIQEFMQSQGHKNFTLSAGENLATALTKANINPGLMRRYLPMLGLGTLALKGLGGFEPGAPPEPFDFFAGMDRTPYFFPFPGSQFKAAAGGGEMTNFPRKNGAIYGPGTETSDDIPAMLSDGEFVMTARAVRGAGNGSRQDGMKRMYDMMRTFEGRAARG